MWDPHNCNNKDHSILGCDRGVIWCLYGDFIIVTAGLMEVLLDMKLKSNCVSL